MNEKKEGIELRHGVWLENLSLGRECYDFNRNELKRMDDIKKHYCIFPYSFFELLEEKRKKWKKKIVEYTVGYDRETKIWAIAIVHPRDNFNRKIGARIVKGRITRIKIGKTYDELPRTLFITESGDEI